MPRLPSIWKMIQYLPIIVGLLNYVRPRETVDSAGDLQDEMQEFRLSVADRLLEMENESARLHARIREMQAALLWLRLLIWIGFGIFTGAVITFIVLFAVLFHHLP